MLKNMTPYDETTHRWQLGLVEPADQPSSAPVPVSLELVDLTESTNDLVADDPGIVSELQVGL
jgi:hypothetical protein